MWKDVKIGYHYMLEQVGHLSGVPRHGGQQISRCNVAYLSSPKIIAILQLAIRVSECMYVYVCVCMCVCMCVYMCACVNKTPEELQYQQSFVSAGEDMVSTDKYGVDLTSMGSEHLLSNIFHYPH